jgi:hypothetical protein
MFFTYVGRELRRRRRQALGVALGLALGSGCPGRVTCRSNSPGESSSGWRSPERWFGIPR